VHRQSMGSEEGFSLAEILVTIAIVAITFTAILGGLMTSITASALQRNEATADTVARSAAEWVKDNSLAYNSSASCDGTSSYSPSGSWTSGFSVKIVQVKYWTGTTPIAGTPSSIFKCPGADHGLQLITIQVKSPDGQVTEMVQIIKRSLQ
jgi:prepilin-type N-terminal cleavage/methylation domain-containing protein